MLASSGTDFPKGFYERFARYLAGRARRGLFSVYPHAPSDMAVHPPGDFGALRIGHEGAFSKGMEPV